jgi:hypothetical protein
VSARTNNGRRESDSGRSACVSCEAELPANAAFCPACGASREGEVWEECVIAWWRGYVKGELVAVVRAEHGYRVIARSGPFPWLRPQPEPPKGKQANARLAALTHALEQAGWVRSGEGAVWCSYRFRRQLEPARRPVSARHSPARASAPER